MSNNNNTQSPIDILVVEDDQVDVEMIRRAFRKTDITHTIHYAESGVEALEMLRGENNREKIPFPKLILVDINMPMMNGIEMLQEMRKDEELKQNIAFILTTSARMEDKAAAYSLNAAGYFLKENIDHLIGTLSPYCQGNQFPSPR